MYGPPGTGKTLCARAVANRTDACFIRVIGSELVQKYVGEGARMVRELFEMARAKKVSTFFIDFDRPNLIYNNRLKNIFHYKVFRHVLFSLMKSMPLVVLVLMMELVGTMKSSVLC